MKADFDRAAPNYDTTFTHSVIGRLQRGLVYRQFSQITGDGPKTILEVNCGTGEDAIWLAGRRHKVTATDISQEMITVAQSKSGGANPIFERADINGISKTFGGKEFDLIFSNFGGLNCLSPLQLKAFLTESVQILSPNGGLFLVIMPKNTLWETLYFIGKGKLRTAFRRSKANLTANVDGEKVNTHYYNPKQIVHLAEGKFKTLRIRPVGFFIPPSYLEPFFKDRPVLMGFLNKLERKISGLPWLSRFADHYIIVLQKK